MNLLECILTENPCYKARVTMKHTGVMVHSTGANNPSLKRYVQPAPGQKDYTKLLKLLGDNRNDNDWNRAGVKKCVHAFIGKLADGSIATVQTLPWNWRGWHAGTGSKGSANNSHLSFEICEDDLEDEAYFQKVYREAVEFTAHLCTLNKWDPLADGVVICHAEGRDRGIASNHGDVEHWFPKHGKSMDDFRADVAKVMKGEDDMTQEQFDKMMDDYLERKSQEQPSKWSAEARAWAEKKGIIKGTGKRMEYCRPVTREELAQMLYNMNQ